MDRHSGIRSDCLRGWRGWRRIRRRLLLLWHVLRCYGDVATGGDRGKLGWLVLVHIPQCGVGVTTGYRPLVERGVAEAQREGA